MDDSIRIYNQINNGELRNKYLDDCISYEKGLYFLKDGLHTDDIGTGARNGVSMGKCHPNGPGIVKTIN